MLGFMLDLPLAAAFDLPLAAAFVVPILARRPGFVVVAKPAGLDVHRCSRRKSVALMQLVRDQLSCHVNPVHRLDAGTSGCLIFAEDAETHAMLQRALSRARKTYFAMVRAEPASRAALRGGPAGRSHNTLPHAITPPCHTLPTPCPHLA